MAVLGRLSVVGKTKNSKTMLQSISIELDVYSNAGENDNKLTEYPETLLENTEHRTSPLSPPAKQQNNIATLRAHTGHW
jgi:hypothetical protein